MTEERVGIIRAALRFLRFWNWRKARYIIRAADEQFTGSLEGIGAAYDIYNDELIGRFNHLRDSTSSYGVQVEEKKIRLGELNDREQELLEVRDGALSKIGNLRSALALTTNDTEKQRIQSELDKWEAAFTRYDTEIENIERESTELESEIQVATQELDRLVIDLSDLQHEVESLKGEKAREMSKWISNQAIIQARDEAMGLRSSLDRGPIEAVRKMNKELSAKARITERLAGTDIKHQERELRQEGRESRAHDRLEEMLAARIAERAARTGEAPLAETLDTRPEI